MNEAPKGKDGGKTMTCERYMNEIRKETEIEMEGRKETNSQLFYRHKSVGLLDIHAFLHSSRREIRWSTLLSWKLCFISVPSSE